MSTFAPGPAVLVALLLTIFASSRRHLRVQPAMHLIRTGRGPARSTRTTERLLTPTMLLAMMATGNVPPANRVGQLLHDALGLRGPQQPEFGRAARSSPLRRVRSAVLLIVLLVALGIATAAAIGLIAFLAGFLLEQAIK
jgi:hypothetical protein